MARNGSESELVAKGARKITMQEVDILVNGKRVPQFPHDGKLFVVAKPGSQYEIRIKNNSTSRIMAVAAIDGLNVITGEPAETDGPGYVLDGYNSYTIKGWRTSNEEVRPFEFSKKDKSYAAKSEDGDVRNCGVIGVAIHAEKIKQPKVIKEKEYIPYPYPVDRPYPVYPKPYYPWRPYRWPEIWCGGTTGYFGNASITYTSGNQSSQNTGQSVMDSCSIGDTGRTDIIRSANFTAQSPAKFDMGTKFSESSLEDKVENTKFKSSHIIQKIEIYYASEEQLRRMGIAVDKETKVAFPEAFAEGRGFCKMPRE